jgi:hypothetical protein
MATIDVSLDELTGATIIITAIISTTDRLARRIAANIRQAAGAVAQRLMSGAREQSCRMAHEQYGLPH